MDEQIISKLADGLKISPDVVQKEIEAIRTGQKQEFPSASDDFLDKCAIDMFMSTTHRKNTMVKVYSGMFLGCDGKVNDWSRFEYNKIYGMAQKMPRAEAIKKGLLNARGVPLYQKDRKFGAGKPIVIMEPFIKITGVVEDGGKLVPMTFKVYNLNLLPEVILNKPVRFHASNQSFSSKEKKNELWLESEPNTIFQYSDVPSDAPDMAMEWASYRYPELPVKELPSLMQSIPIKDTTPSEDGKTEKEEIVVDKRYWLLKDLVVSFVAKVRSGKVIYEFVHPDLLNWTVIVMYDPVDHSYELVRDHRANILANVASIDAQEKRIVLNGMGMWQSSQYRMKGPVKYIDPTKVKMTFKD